MKVVKGFVVMLLLYSFYPLQAQYNTGDPELDKTLITLDTEASISFGAFKANISSRYHVSAGMIEYLTVDIGMTSGDIYLTLEIAEITKKSVNQVVVAYESNKGQGWGVIARELGIEPGSIEFHILKGNAKSQENKPDQAYRGNGKI